MSEKELREALAEVLSFTIVEESIGKYRCTICDADVSRAPFAHDPDGCVGDDARRLLASIPAEPEQDGEVEGLRAVAETAQFLVGSIELGERPALVLNAASGVNRALAALDYPRDDEGLIDFARLAPARDDTSVDCCDCPKCGEWRDSPTADCAACGFDPARDDTSGGAK